jgi:hypothetical protein
MENGYRCWCDHKHHMPFFMLHVAGLIASIYSLIAELSHMNLFPCEFRTTNVGNKIRPSALDRFNDPELAAQFKRVRDYWRWLIAHAHTYFALFDEFNARPETFHMDDVVDCIRTLVQTNSTRARGVDGRQSLRRSSGARSAGSI